MASRGTNRSLASRAPRRGRTPVQTNPNQALLAARDISRAYTKQLNNEAAITLGRSLTYQVTSLWWLALTQSALPLRPLLQPLLLVDLPDTLAALANDMAQALHQLPPDEAVYQIGLIYTSMLPDEHRTKHGVYYTPPPLAERLLDQATSAGLDWTSCRVLDPACGGGAFLAPVVRRMLAATDCNPAILLRTIGQRLKGYELDPFAAWLAQVGVDTITRPLVKTESDQIPVVVEIRDTLTATAPTRKFDLVIGNPPYGRVSLDASQRREFAHVLYGHANLYALFMDIALRHTKRNGFLGYLTPTSFLAGEYFKNLRGHLFAKARPVTLDLVAVRKGVFEEVLQEVLLATYRAGSSRATASVHLAEPLSASKLKITPAGTFRLPAQASMPWLMPRSPSEAAILDSVRALPCKLEDWGYAVSTGPLVWNRHKPQLTNNKGRGCLPLIWAEAVTPDGAFLWRALKKNHTPFFRVCDGDDWLITRQPCVVLQRTTAKEQNRRLIAAEIPASFLATHGAAVIENHLNMMRPTGNKPAVSPTTLAAFLNSRAADRIFRCISGSVAVSAYELEAMPLPAPRALKRLTELLASEASRKELDAECDRITFGGNLA